jgi:hypothetical protein
LVQPCTFSDVLTRDDLHGATPSCQNKKLN